MCQGLSLVSRVISKLAGVLPGVMAGPLAPPFSIAAWVSMEKRPCEFRSLWHAPQRETNSGRTSRVKSIAATLAGSPQAMTSETHIFRSPECGVENRIFTAFVMIGSNVRFLYRRD